MLVATLVALQTANTGVNMQHVLAIDVPTMTAGRTNAQVVDFYQNVVRRISELPGVERVAIGSAIPWRDGGGFGGAHPQFSVEGYTPADGEESPRAGYRIVSPGFFTALGVPLLAGRDFTDADRTDGELVVI